MCPTDDSSLPIRRRVVYRGRVQGVGFRVTVAGIARRFPIDGYVKNLPSGDVELLADAPPDVLHQFLREIQRAFASNIASVTVEELPRNESLGGFEIHRR